MTNVLDTSTALPTAPAWKSPLDGLWVSSSDGVYLGMVERRGELFIASDHQGQLAGEFASLEAAQAALSSGTPVRGGSLGTTLLNIGLFAALAFSSVASLGGMALIS